MDQSNDIQTEYIKNSIIINRPANEVYEAIQDPLVRKQITDDLLKEITVTKTIKNSSVHWRGQYEGTPYKGVIELKGTSSKGSVEMELTLSFTHQDNFLEKATAQIIILAGETITHKALRRFKEMMEISQDKVA